MRKKPLRRQRTQTRAETSEETGTYFYSTTAFCKHPNKTSSLFDREPEPQGYRSSDRVSQHPLRVYRSAALSAAPAALRQACFLQVRQDVQLQEKQAGASSAESRILSYPLECRCSWRSSYIPPPGNGAGQFSLFLPSSFHAPPPTMAPAHIDASMTFCAFS